MDPLTKKYPWYTPYSFSGNKVIAFVEFEGLEEVPFYESVDFVHTTFWAAADGMSNALYYTFEVCITDEVEGKTIRKMMSEMGTFIHPSISDKQLGETFQIRHRGGGTVESDNYVEPQPGQLIGLLDLAVDVLDVAAIIPAGPKAKYSTFMAIKANPIVSKTISNVLRGLKIKNRANEIFNTFTDIGGSGGKFSEVEAEGMAIFEESFNTTIREIKKGDDLVGDFIVQGGKYKNKTVDLVSAVKNKNFNIDKFIESVKRHYLKQGLDFINIDIRHLDEVDKIKVKNYVNEMSEADRLKTILTE